jgi:hypothetical protein
LLICSDRTPNTANYRFTRFQRSCPLRRRMILHLHTRIPWLSQNSAPRRLRDLIRRRSVLPRDRWSTESRLIFAVASGNSTLSAAHLGPAHSSYPCLQPATRRTRAAPFTAHCFNNSHADTMNEFGVGASAAVGVPVGRATAALTLRQFAKAGGFVKTRY